MQLILRLEWELVIVGNELAPFKCRSVGELSSPWVS